MIAHADPVSHAVLVVAAVAVVVWSSRREHGTRSSSLAAATGAVAALAALSPTVEAFADRSYTGHMLQHLVLIVVAAPCLAWGIRTSAPPRHRVQVGVTTRRTLRRISHAVLALGFPTVLLATHLTAWYAAAIESQLVHDAEHAAFIAGAVGLWSLAFGLGSSSPATRILAAFGTIVATALVGIVLTTSASPLVDAYEHRLGSIDALADQRRAGALMWTVGMAIALPVLLAAFWQWADREQRNRVRRERLTDEGLGNDRTAGSGDLECRGQRAAGLAPLDDVSGTTATATRS